MDDPGRQSSPGGEVVASRNSPHNRNASRYSDYQTRSRSRSRSRSPRRGRHRRPLSDASSVRDFRGEARPPASGTSASAKRRRRDRSLSPDRSRSRSRSWSRERDRRGRRRARTRSRSRSRDRSRSRSRSRSRGRSRSRSRDRRRRRVRGGARRHGRRGRRGRSRSRSRSRSPSRSRSRSRSRGYDDSRSPPRRRARYRSRSRSRDRYVRRNDRRGRGRERQNTRPVTFFTDPQVHELFLAAVEEAMRRNQPPFNISLINDVMRRLAPNWSIRGSNYATFQKLCKEKEREGFVSVARMGETVSITAVNRDPRPIEQRPAEDEPHGHRDMTPPHDDRRGRRHRGRDMDDEREWDREREMTRPRRGAREYRDRRDREFSPRAGGEHRENRGRDRDGVDRSLDTMEMDTKPVSGSAVAEDLAGGGGDGSARKMEGTEDEEERMVSGVTEDAPRNAGVEELERGDEPSGGKDDVAEESVDRDGNVQDAPKADVAATKAENLLEAKSGDEPMKEVDSGDVGNTEEGKKHVAEGAGGDEPMKEGGSGEVKKIQDIFGGEENPVEPRDALLLIAEAAESGSGNGVANSANTCGDGGGGEAVKNETQISNRDSIPNGKVNVAVENDGATKVAEQMQVHDSGKEPGPNGSMKDVGANDNANENAPGVTE